jgi:anaerobic ribonucleoside-triphosphate reductase activating protein
MSTSISLSRMHYPVTVLGPGTRIGIWLQGCSIHCPGCVSEDTWDANLGREATIDDVVEQCSEWAREGKFDGVTISGGEPFDQPDALLMLLERLETLRRKSRARVDFLCYSGYPEAFLRAGHTEILGRLDALIPEPFALDHSPGGLWRGSSNQRIVPLSKLGMSRYSHASTQAADLPAVQVVVDDAIWMIGIPRPGDMESIEARMRSRGILLDGVSWR